MLALLTRFHVTDATILVTPSRKTIDSQSKSEWIIFDGLVQERRHYGALAVESFLH